MIDNELLEQGPKFEKGELVLVERRTWRGINKPGGVARVINMIKGKALLSVICCAMLNCMQMCNRNHRIPSGCMMLGIPLKAAVRKKLTKNTLANGMWLQL